MQHQHHLHSRRALILAIGIGTSFAPLLRADVGIGLSPMRLELRLAPGTQQSGALAVTNDSSERLRIRAELLDFYIDATGTPQFSRSYPQESEFSCRKGLAVNPMEWEMDAGATNKVRYTIALPPEAKERSYYCAVGFTAMPTAAAGEGIGLRISVRAVAAFYVMVGNPAIQGGLKDIALEQVADPKAPGWRGVVVLENKGLAVFRSAGELAVLNEQGQVLETCPLTSLPILPKREQRVPVPLKTIVEQGVYTLRVRADIGTGEIQEGTAVVVAHPSTSQPR